MEGVFDRVTSNKEFLLLKTTNQMEGRVDLLNSELTRSSLNRETLVVNRGQDLVQDATKLASKAHVDSNKRLSSVLSTEILKNKVVVNALGHTTNLTTSPIDRAFW